MTVLSRRFLLPTISVALFYIILVTYAMNITIIKDTILGNYALSYKISLLTALLQGMWTAMSFPGLITLFLIALLTGANLTLVVDRLTSLKKFDKLQVVVGGNSLLGIVGSGCAACGLPVLSLLGLSGSMIYLPFHGAELSYLAIVLLGVSYYLLMKKSEIACEVQYDKQRK